MTIITILVILTTITVIVNLKIITVITIMTIITICSLSTAGKTDSSTFVMIILITDPTSRGQLVSQQLVKLTQVHHHGQRVRFFYRIHLVDPHQRRNSKVTFSHVEAQASVVLH